MAELPSVFFNPDARHGLEKDALRQFLRGLDDVAPQEVPTRVSDDVVVDDEVSSPAGNRPDIVIQDPGEFFVCCELKLYSSEGEIQTQRYISDNYIGHTRKEQFPTHGQHYVYIRRPDRPQAGAGEFVNITWRQVRDWLKPLLTNNQGRYPTRTTAQLADFLDTIYRDMTQDEHELALDAIETQLEPISAFYPAEPYYQKCSLRSTRLLTAFEEAGYDDADVGESPATAKLNAQAAGHDFPPIPKLGIGTDTLAQHREHTDR